MKFSVIIPHYEAEDTIQRAIKSVPDSAETITIPDHDQRGPGWARNQGLEWAIGDWIIFLDADDVLEDGALQKIEEHIEKVGSLDLVGYRGMHRKSEAKYWGLVKEELLRKYLRLRMDGSVIFTAFRKSFLDKHELRFAEGYHEDVDFMFKAFKHADYFSYIDEPLYWKCVNDKAITETISERHIDGMMRAWAEIRKEMPPGMDKDFRRGIVGVVATTLRKIHAVHGKTERAMELYEYLYNHKI